MLHLSLSQFLDLPEWEQIEWLAYDKWRQDAIQSWLDMMREKEFAEPTAVTQLMLEML